MTPLSLKITNVISEKKTKKKQPGSKQAGVFFLFHLCFLRKAVFNNVGILSIFMYAERQRESRVTKRLL